MESFIPDLTAPPPPPPPPRPLLERLVASHKRGVTLLKGPKLSKGDVHMWLNILKSRLQEIYGDAAPIVATYRDKAIYVMKNGITSEQLTDEIDQLDGMIRRFEYDAGVGLLNPTSTPSMPPAGKNIFIIHGHDELNTRRLSSLLQNDFHVNPIAIISKPGMSRPIIDKYEDSASACSFAFALITPDDQVTSHQGQYNQGRPNVIFELGWFVGRLGKHRVTILLKEGTRVHSDIDGVSRIQFKDNIEEKYLDIQRELSAARII